MLLQSQKRLAWPRSPLSSCKSSGAQLHDLLQIFAHKLHTCNAQSHLVHPWGLGQCFEQRLCRTLTPSLESLLHAAYAFSQLPSLPFVSDTVEYGTRYPLSGTAHRKNDTELGEEQFSSRKPGRNGGRVNNTILMNGTMHRVLTFW